MGTKVQTGKKKKTYPVDQIESMEYQVLRYLMSINGTTAPRTTEGIALHVEQGGEILRHVLARLLSKGGLSMSRKAEFFLTQFGAELVEGARAKPELTRSAAAQRLWKTEVLSGINNDGKQTEIENAALSTGRTPKSSFRNNINIDQISLYRGLMDAYGISPIEISEGLSNGSIRWCFKCKKYGVFSRCRSRSTGYQNECKNCRKGK